MVLLECPYMSDSTLRLLRERREDLPGHTIKVWGNPGLRDWFSVGYIWNLMQVTPTVWRGSCRLQTAAVARSGLEVTQYASRSFTDTELQV